MHHLEVNHGELLKNKMGYTTKGVKPYPVNANPAKVTRKLTKDIAGNVQVKKNTLCKSCK